MRVAHYAGADRSEQAAAYRTVSAAPDHYHPCPLGQLDKSRYRWRVEQFAIDFSTLSELGGDDLDSLGDNPVTLVIVLLLQLS